MNEENIEYFQELLLEMYICAIDEDEDEWQDLKEEWYKFQKLTESEKAQRRKDLLAGKVF